MTLENCKRLLNHYEKSKDNRELSEQARLNAKVAYKDMLANLANPKKNPPTPSKK